MKRQTLLALAVCTLVGCEQQPTEVTQARGPALRASSATSNLSVSTVIPIDLIVFVPCANGGAGENIEVSGPLHVVLKLNFSSSGNVSDFFHFQPQGVSGVGLSSGAKYQATGITNSKDHFNGLPVSGSFINNFHMVGQGSGNNFFVHETFHFTVNANGALTALVDNFFVTCK